MLKLLNILRVKNLKNKNIINNDNINININNNNDNDNININNINYDYCFIILRHVNSILTNNYWIECYDCIRKNYGNIKIIIIDDNSNYEFINSEKENILINCTIIKSEFPKRGELLPYYYFYLNKFADKAVIIHDSVFIQKYIDFSKTNDIDFLWNFNNKYLHDNSGFELKMLLKMKNCNKLKEIFLNNKWKGCFGVMSVITHDFICKLNYEYNFFCIINDINNRNKRSHLERIFAVCCYTIKKNINVYFGNIFRYIEWGYKYENYIKNKLNKDIIKVWTGR